MDELVVRKIIVDKGPQEKRVRPAPMGRAFRVLHRKSHVTIELSDAQRGRRGKEKHGPESPSVRIPARFQPDLALALVLDEGLRRTCLHEDLKLRKELKGRLSHAGVSEIDIERFANRLKVNIQTSRPGIIIGKRGAEVDKLRDELQKRTKSEVHINIIEIQRPETDAQLVAESIALQLERRVAFRRAMKKGIESALRFGAQGIKIRCAGRLERRRDRAGGVVPGGAPAAPHPEGRHRLRLRRGEHDLRQDRRQDVDLPGRAAQGEEPAEDATRRDER